MRIQFEIDKEQLEAIHSLRDNAGLKTNKSLFNMALALFEWAVKEKKEGRIIASADKEMKTLREVVIPVLSRN